MSRGTRSAASFTQGCSRASDNTKAARLVLVYEHGTHSMGHCPNLINEMMMLTGVFSLLHPVTDPRRAKYPRPSILHALVRSLFMRRQMPVAILAEGG